MTDWFKVLLIAAFAVALSALAGTMDMQDVCLVNPMLEVCQ